MMENKTVKVMEERWDYLIVLDACRYDLFEKLYRNYLPGANLSVRKSIGSATVEWRDKSFPEFYDSVVYVSSNPYINSDKDIKGFCGGDHFYKTIDVWKTGWDHQRGTVLPATVTLEALKAIHANPDKRIIIHYLQPHAPYLKFGSECRGFPIPDLQKKTVLWGIDITENKSIRKKIYHILLPIMKRFKRFGNHSDWMLSQFLGLAPCTPMDAVRRRYGNEGLLRAYQENLQEVLKEVAVLLACLSGTIVVTSDHGECLGEQQLYSHDLNSQHPLLRNIPWYQIQQEGKSIPEAMLKEGMQKNEDASEVEIENRLRDLGYL